MSNGKAKGLTTIFRSNLILVWILILMVVVFSIKSDTFLTRDNIMEIFRSCGMLSLMVLGVTWVVAMGEIDIAFPQTASLASMVVAFCLARGFSWPTAIAAGILVGLPLGLLAGFLITKFRFPAIIASIAVGQMGGAIANMIHNGQPLYISAITPAMNFFVYGIIASVPFLFIVIVCIYAFTTWIQDHTTTGQHLYALGENRKAALEAGINEERVIMSFFALSALLASTSGVILAASFTSGQARLGDTFFIDGLTAVFLGAMVVKMGKPNVIGTLLGAIIIAALTNGLTMLNVPFYVGSVLKGIMMICGVATIIIAKKRAG